MTDDIAGYIVNLEARIAALEKRQGYSGKTPSMGNWHTFQLEANWSHAAGYQEVQYAIDSSGIVHIRGVATKLSGSNYLGQLPVGHRPNKEHVIVISGTVTSATYIQITSDGIITVHSNVTIGTIGIMAAFPLNDGANGNPMPLNSNWYPYFDPGYQDKWGWPYLHKHASGAMIASGTIRGGSETLLEIAGFLDTDQSNEFAHIMRGVGYSSPGDTPNITRMDTSPGKIAYVRGGAATFSSTSGWVWLSNTYDAAEQELLTLAPGVMSIYTSGGGDGWHPRPRVSKDKSGWCILSGIGMNVTVTPGTTFMTIPSASLRPPAKILVPVTSGENPVAYPATIDTDGTIKALDTIPGTSYLSVDGVHFHTT